MRRGEADDVARDMIVVDCDVDRVCARRYEVATAKSRDVDPLRIDLQEGRIELDRAGFRRTRGTRVHEARHREYG